MADRLIKSNLVEFQAEGNDLQDESEVFRSEGLPPGLWKRE